MLNTFECVNCGLKHSAEQVLNSGGCLECGENIISYTQDAASEIVSLRDALKIAQQCLDGDVSIQAFEMVVTDLEV